MDEERVNVGEGGVWDILEEVNVVGVVDLAIAVVMVCRKSGRRSYVTKGGIIVSVNELKRRFANYGRRRERGREKSLIVKAFADFGEVHEAGVVVGGREGVLVKVRAVGRFGFCDNNNILTNFFDTPSGSSWAYYLPRGSTKTKQKTS